MKSNVNSEFLRVITILFALICLVSLARADHQKAVSGIIVNIGVVPAEKALGFSGEAATHDKGQSSGAQQLVVSLSDAKQGIHIADAQVTVEIKDPKGNVEKKTLLPANTTGIPDYSGIFRFGYSGKYAIRVVVALKGSTKQLKANFIWTHAI